MKKNANVYAVILAGGNGERFWPMSTPERPKQFLALFGGKPLIRQAVERLKGFIPPERVLVVTSAALAPLTREVLPELPAGNVIGEPCRRDTAAAMACAVGMVKRLGGPSAVACVLTSDQIIRPAAKFRRVLADAAGMAADSGSVVTIGIVPNSPATGFGYIECGRPVRCTLKTGIREVKRFVEKPDLTKAKAYVKSGRYRWNSGMFIWRAEVLENLFREHAPDIAGLIGRVETAKKPENVLGRCYPELRKISFDYAIMEKISDILVADGDFEWDDVGTWTALPNHFRADRERNVKLGSVTTLDVSDSIVVSDDHRLAVLGLDNVVVIHTSKATLVCAKDRVQDIKRLLQNMV